MSVIITLVTLFILLLFPFIFYVILYAHLPTSQCFDNYMTLLTNKSLTPAIRASAFLSMPLHLTRSTPQILQYIAVLFGRQTFTQ